MRRMFSENQIEKMILSQVQQGIENGDINLEDAPVVEFPITTSGMGGRTFVASYCKAVVYHGILFVALNGYLKNETESSISGGTIYFECQLDEKTASKIYDFDNKKLTETNSSNPYQMIYSQFLAYGQYGNSSKIAIVSRDANLMKLKFALYVDSMSAGATNIISGRSFLLLV